MDRQLAEALAQMNLARNAAAPGANQANPQQQQAGLSTGGAAGGDVAGACGGGPPLGAEGAVGGKESGHAAFSQIFPMLQGYMNQDTALACRAVCKDWKTGVDVALSECQNANPSNPGTSRGTGN